MKSKWMRRFFLGSFPAVMLGVSLCASAQQTEFRSGENPSQVYSAQYTLTACYPSTPPAGYVWTSSNEDISCYSVGGPNPSERQVFTSYFDKAVGAEMRTCSSFVPPGWVLISMATDDLYVCGHAGHEGVGEPLNGTLYTIKRVN